MNLTLQDLAPGRTPTPTGAMHTYQVDDVSADMSFLEMLDVLNEELIAEGRGARSPSTPTAARASAACAA